MLLKEKLNESDKTIKINFTDASKKVEIKKKTLNGENIGLSKVITEEDRNSVIESYRKLKKSGKIK